MLYTKIKVLYVHGFHGSSTGQSYQNIKEALPEGYELFSIDYDENNCEHARNQIYEYVKENSIDLVIGSSLGGFIVMTLHGLPRFVINPCMHPSKELYKLTEVNDEFNKMIKTYEKYESWLEKYSDIEERILAKGFFGDHDELFGTKYMREFHLYYGNYEIINSGHHISKEGAVEMFKNIDNYWTHVSRLSKNDNMMNKIISETYE